MITNLLPRVTSVAALLPHPGLDLYRPCRAALYTMTCVAIAEGCHNTHAPALLRSQRPKASLKSSALLKKYNLSGSIISAALRESIVSYILPFGLRMCPNHLNPSLPVFRIYAAWCHPCRKIPFRAKPCKGLTHPARGKVGAQRRP